MMKLISPLFAVLITHFLLSAAFPGVTHLNEIYSSKTRNCPFSHVQREHLIKVPSTKIKRSSSDNRRIEERASSWSPAQRISVSGVHSFIPPGPGDLRGPCPGLNALSNHGYMARDGVTNLLEAAEAAQKVFGIAADLSLAMSAFAVVTAGDPLTTKWSIGDPPPSGLLNLGSILFNAPVGLSGTRNAFETDSSITRPDAFLNNGDSSSLRLELFKGLLASNPNPALNDFKSHDIWKRYRLTRLQDSISQNPNFFWGPFSGVIVGEAGVFFPPELMSNHTPEAPDGALTKEVLYSFYSIKQGTNGELVYTPGNERIPDNWYRQPTDGMSALHFLTLTANLIREHPQTGVIGGNTGTVNSFTGIDLSGLTGGVFNAADLTDPSKLMCFTFQFLDVALPGLLQGSLKELGSAALKLLRGTIGPLIPDDCPLMTSFDDSLLVKFPGARRGN